MKNQICAHIGTRCQNANAVNATCLLEMCKSDPKPIRIRSDPIFSDFGSDKIISDRIGSDKVVL